MDVSFITHFVVKKWNKQCAPGTVEYARNVRTGEIGIARDVTNVSMAHRFPARNVAQGNLRLGKRLLGGKKEEGTWRQGLWGLGILDISWAQYIRCYMFGH